MKRVKFPITVSSEDGEYVVADGVAELESTVGYLTDWSQRYECYDDNGQRLRLAIDQSTLLFVSHVPNEWSREELQIRDSYTNNEVVYGEFIRGVLHRTLELDGRGLALPGQWEDEVEQARDHWGETSSVTASQFNSDWLKARLPTLGSRWMSRIRRRLNGS